MTGKIKPPRVMWVVYSPGADGTMWQECTGRTKFDATDEVTWHDISWNDRVKAGWIVVKYVVAS
jgi:hypothetical protein